MSIKQLFPLLIFLAVSHVQGQDKPHTVIWKDGTEVQYRLLDNKVKEYSRWNLTGGPLFAYNGNQLLLGASLAGNYEYLNILKLNAGADVGFPIEFGHFESNDPQYLDDFTKPFKHYSAYIGLRLFRSYSNRDVPLELTETWDTSYYIQDQMEAETSFHLMAGYDYFFQRISSANRPLESADPLADSVSNISYRAINTSSENLRVGLRYRLKSYWAYEVDNRPHKRFNDLEVYMAMLIPFRTNLQALRIVDGGTAIEVQEGYIVPEFTRPGFLVGIGGVNGGKVIKFRGEAEVGILPGLEKEHNFYACLKVGVGIGRRLVRE